MSNVVLRRAAASVVGASLALTAVIGFAHTKPGRPLLGWMGRHGLMPGASCPLGYDKEQSPEQKEAARRRFSAAHAGGEQASARPALGFALDQTTRADVQAWASAHALHCVPREPDADLDCANVPAAALPAPVGEVGVHGLWFKFGGHDTLVSVVAVRRDPSAAAIGATFREVEDEVGAQAGAPTKTLGGASPEELSSGLLYQASAEYRFRDYYAVARATNMGDAFVLTEEYRSLAD